MHRDATRLSIGACSLFVVLLAFCTLVGVQASWADIPDDSGNTPDPPLSSGEVVDPSPPTEAPDSTDKTACSITYRVAQSSGTWQAWKQDKEVAGSEDGSTQIGSIALKVSGIPKGAVQYQVHVAESGWTTVKGDGSSAGKASSGKSIDAIKIALTGNLSKTYTVKYRTNTEAGWQGWKKNGAISGSTKGTPLRAIQVKLVKKTTATAKGTGIVGVRYRAKMKTSGWTISLANNEKAGTAKLHQGMRKLRVSLDKGTYTGHVKYSIRSSNGTWSAWAQDGKLLSSSKYIEAVKIKLSGKIAKRYDVVYQAYVNGYRWLPNAYNGKVTGARGNGHRIESLRIKLVPKEKHTGWTNENGNWSYYQSGTLLKNTWLETNDHPLYTPESPETQRYWIDAKGNLAISRYVNPKKAIDSNAGMVAYATSSGYVARGKFENDDGILLAGENGSLPTKTRWLTTSDFDGSSQRYRLVSNGTCAVVKTGFFKVAGKKYYAWEDGRGYVMRSETKNINYKWYTANAKGVLTKPSAKKIIERYLDWAIEIANDDSHGYSQAVRWGPDYDCSSFVCASLLAAGFPDSGASWTGNMRSCLRTVGFKWHSGMKGLRRGDIVLVHNGYRQHTEIYLGKGLLVGAHIAETGGIYGAAGDQTGREICITSYYNAPWEGYLRLKI